MPLELTKLREGSTTGTARVEFKGSLDTATVGECEQALAELVDDLTLKTLVFDLAGLEFLSSAGIRVLLSTRRKLTKRKARLLMVNLQPQIEKVFAVIKALPDIRVFSSVEELDTYLSNLQAKVTEGEA